MADTKSECEYGTHFFSIVFLIKTYFPKRLQLFWKWYRKFESNFESPFRDHFNSKKKDLQMSVRTDNYN